MLIELEVILLVLWFFFFPSVCNRRAILISLKQVILFDRPTCPLNPSELMAAALGSCFLGQVLPFDSLTCIRLCSSTAVLTLPLGPSELAGHGKFIVVIAPPYAGGCHLSGTWSASWGAGGGLKKPLDTCPAYINCRAQITARRRRIYSLNILF